MNLGDKSFKGHVAMFMAQLIFGINAVIGKMALESPLVEPRDLTFWRMFGAMILMWITSLFFPRERVPAKDLFLLFLASMFGVVINQTLFLKGLAITSAVNAALIIAMSPIITMIFAAIFLKEPISLRKAAGVMMGVSGVLVLILSGSAVGAGNDILGDLLCLGSIVAFALYLTLFRDLIRRYKPVTLMKWMFFFAAVCLVPFSYDSLSPSLWMQMPTEIIIESLFVVVFATFITYLLLPIGQQALRPTIVSMYSNLQPLVASIAAIALGVGDFGWSKSIAGLLIVLGVYTVTTSKARVQVVTEKA